MFRQPAGAPPSRASGDGAALATLPVLAPAYVEPLLRARAAGESLASTSLDLGMSRVEVRLTPHGVVLPGGETVPWEDVERVARATTGNLGGRCFVVRPYPPAADAPPLDAPPPDVPLSDAPASWVIEEAQLFSAETNRRYSLLATATAPTMLISGVQMHRTKGMDPWGDTLAKARAAAPLIGPVLDTATGLGYTAIVAAQTAASVVTVELDPAALEIARLNPWSQRLFGDPKITQRLGDSFDVIQEFPDGAFTRVVHDPPAFSLAGQLYSAEFYRQLHRVLGRGGRVFHYLGNAQSGSGHRVTRGAVQRLQEAGFRRVVSHPEAFGVVAFK